MAIDVDEVTAVLLADGWYDVANESFNVDSFEFVWHHPGPQLDQFEREFEVLHSRGTNGVCATGFEFTTTEGTAIAGPLTAILAVKRVVHICPDCAGTAPSPDAA
ncbi:MAG: hypothetical protein DLM60_05005 [Pseudonocardiales bacterium]|nr:MAG: hypothetical protein DLM60_05005 [Pseudonocardiales bacterium]